MLALLLLFLAQSDASFRITDLVVPPIVPPLVSEVDIECRYAANFTLLNWFKGPNEFFRYKPAVTPSTRTFSVLGISKIEVLECGPTVCRLRIGGLSSDATGLYRCDLERDVPPYKFESRKAYMEVHGHEISRPLLEGLQKEYGDGDVITALCRSDTLDLHWYVNGREVEDMRGKPGLRKNSSRLIFQGVPPKVTVQCAELKNGRLAGSKEHKARWKETTNRDDTAQEQKKISAGYVNSSKLGLVFLALMINFVRITCVPNPMT